MPKKPYSAKQKKQQLKDTRARKQDGPKYMANWNADVDEPTRSKGDNTKTEAVLAQADVHKINQQPNKKGSNSKFTPNNYLLHFLKESDDVILKRKKEARRPYKRLQEISMEFGVSDFYPSHMYLDFPKRPNWSYNLSKEELDRRENSYFQSYLGEVISGKDSDSMSFFELNLENWRQLWRVVELSDILLIMADVRFPVVHVSPSLVAHLQNVLHKPVVIVINKIDMVPVSMAIAAKRYLQRKFPGVHVVFFTSFLPQVKIDDYDDSSKRHNMMKKDDGGPTDFDPATAMFHRSTKSASTYLGPEQLFRVVEGLVDGRVDLSSWRQRLEEEGLFSCGDSEDCELLYRNSASSNERSNSESEESDSPENPDLAEAATADDSNDDCNDCTNQKEKEASSASASGGQHEKGRRIISENAFQDGMVTLGCIGYPNVGKSSVLNALKGKKVVSVSQTPGHTKHLQTIFLSSTVRLCDCPGLVFPSIVPKPLQVIAGLFPVAQVREPYSVIQFLAERIDLQTLLKIKPPPDSMGDFESEENFEWSAFDICEAWAIKCGFFTPKAARPDTYRAANNLLRQAVCGQIRLCLPPPNYSIHRADLKNDLETMALHRILRARSRGRITFYEEGEEEEGDAESGEESDSDIATSSHRHNPFLLKL